MTALVSPPASTTGSRSVRSVAVASAAAAVVAIIAVSVVSWLGRALGAPSDFPGLQPRAYIVLVILGVVAGALGWHIVGGRARDPRHTLTRLVPAVLVLSFIPDVALGLSGSAWSGVATLMAMHLAVAAVALPVYARLLPLR